MKFYPIELIGLNNGQDSVRRISKSLSLDKKGL